MQGLLRSIPDLIDEMEHNHETAKSKFPITPKKMDFVRTLNMSIAFIINLLMLSYTERLEETNFREIYTPELVEQIIWYLGCMQVRPLIHSLNNTRTN